LEKILITGASGNLGLWVVSNLAREGYSVTAASHSNISAVTPTVNVKYTLLDVCDENAVSALLEDNFDHIIHLAAFNNISDLQYAEKSLNVNVGGTLNILDSIAKKQLKTNIIYISTFHVYGKYTGIVTEQTKTNPLNMYALTHLHAEDYIGLYAKTHNIKFKIFRLTNSYGCPADRQSTQWNLVLNDFCRSAIERGEIRINSNPHTLRDFIWMGDVCAILTKSINNQKLINQTFNLSSGKAFTLLQIAQYVQQAFFNTFNKPLVIITNSHQHKKTQSLKVNNMKLLKEIDHVMSNKFVPEAMKIFTLLTGENK